MKEYSMHQEISRRRFLQGRVAITIIGSSAIGKSQFIYLKEKEEQKSRIPESITKAKVPGDNDTR